MAGRDRAERLSDVYEHASAAYFVSHENLELSRYEFGSPLQNAKVVRQAFNVRYEACPSWPGDCDNALALACVGRFDVAHKGQDILLRVLSLRHWRERNIRLSLFGKGPNERGLRRMVDALKLRNVVFHGHTDDVEQIWAEHHGLVLPTRFEGMPLVVIEAMLCGRPCITTDVSGNAELVRDGINGFLAKAPTVELFDEAMNRAWENRQRLKEMGEAAAMDVRQWVSPDPGADLARDLESVAEGTNRAGEMRIVGAPRDSVELSR